MTTNEIRTQELYEMECARIWEQINMADPNENKLIEAAHSLNIAIEHLNTAVDWVADAAQELSGTTMEDRVMSLVQDIEDIICDLKEMQKRWKRGIA